MQTTIDTTKLLHECLDTLVETSNFLQRLLYSHADDAPSPPLRSPTAAQPPTIGISPAIGISPFFASRRPSEVTRRDDTIVKLIAFADELDAKIAALKLKAMPSPAMHNASLDIGDHAVSEMGTIQIADNDPLFVSFDERKQRVSFRTRSQVGGWLSVGVDPGISPSEPLTPIQRSVSLAFGGGRRRRSTFHFLAGMPALALDADSPTSQLTSRISRKATRHTNVFRSEMEFKSQLKELQIPFLPVVQTPQFDACSTDTTAFRRTFNGLPTLTVVAMNIFVQYSFMIALRIDASKLINFFNTISSCHREDNPYHNHLHAANTLQMVHLYAKQPSSGVENFADLEICALLFAALNMHVGHLGVSDTFLDRRRHPLRAIYPEGTQRSMSLALALAVLSSDSCNFLSQSFDASLSSSQGPAPLDYESFVLLTSQLVLHSDEALHQELMTQLKWIQDKGFVDNEHIIFVLATVLRVASSAHLLKSPAVFHEWIARRTAENYRQGAAQLGHHLETSGGTLPTRPLSKADEACLLPNQYPDGVRIVDFFANMTEFVLLPLVQFPKNVFPPSWIERAKDNISTLVGSAGVLLEPSLQRRVSELFDYSAAFANPVRFEAWTDVAEDQIGYFSMVLPEQAARLSRASIRNFKPSSAAASFRGSKRDLRSQSSQNQHQASVATLTVVDDLVRHLRRLFSATLKKCNVTGPWSHLEHLERLATFSQDWVSMLQNSSAPHCAAAFLSGAPATLASLLARPYDLKSSILARNEPQATTSEIDAVAITKALVPPAERGPGLANVASSIVGNLTQMWLEFSSYTYVPATEPLPRPTPSLATTPSPLTAAVAPVAPLSKGDTAIGTLSVFARRRIAATAFAAAATARSASIASSNAASLMAMDARRASVSIETPPPMMDEDD